MNRKHVSLILVVVGTVLVAAAMFCYFYYQTQSLSEYFDWSLVTYPYRQYTWFFAASGVFLVVVGLLLPEKQTLPPVKSLAENPMQP